MIPLNHKDVWIRALKTAIQAFVGVFAVSASDLLNTFQKGGMGAGKAALVSLVSAAIAAAVSAVWNYLLQTQPQKT